MSLYAEPPFGTPCGASVRTDVNFADRPGDQMTPRAEDREQKSLALREVGVFWWLEMPSVILEVLMRNVYWRWAGLRRWRRRRERRRRPAIQACAREDLCAHLESIGVRSGALVMLHTRVSGVHFLAGAAAEEVDSWHVSRALLSLVFDLLGPTGTLAMVTNAKFQHDDLEGKHSANEAITYDPERTPCSVGLANELFWRGNGVKRSLYPFNMLAARGPLADELLRDNLNERKPSPHGVDSGYCRFCQLNGLVVSVGVPLRDCITIAHVVEEVRLDWPIKDFFIEKRYRVVQGGVAKEWAIRLPREKYDRFCHCGKKMGLDLVAEGVIHEGRVGTLRVDWARAGEVFEFFWRKTEKGPYPYYGLWGSLST